MSYHYAIGYGSNKGQRRTILLRAVDFLRRHGVDIYAASAVVKSDPMGGPLGQGQFLNGVWLAKSVFGPHGVLAILQRCESALGRTRSVLWGARTLDLDLLLAKDWPVIANAVLSVPHPGLHERDFVLRPLQQVAADWQHPALGCEVGAL